MEDEEGKGAEIRKRTFEFGCAVVSLHRRIYRNAVDLRDLSRQTVNSGTAIAASLEEADAGKSRAYFISKCTISLKEAREVRNWLRVLYRSYKNERPSIEKLGKEATQIIAILTTIVKNTKENVKSEE